MWTGFTLLTFRVPFLRLGNFRTLSSCVVKKSINWSADCAALHYYGPLETAPLEGFGSPRAAMGRAYGASSHGGICSRFYRGRVPMGT